MAHGANPNLKRDDKGQLGRYCETCHRMIKINRCEIHVSITEREPCYFCHLIKWHMSKGNNTKDSKNYPKKTLEQKA